MLILMLCFVSCSIWFYIKCLLFMTIRNPRWHLPQDSYKKTKNNKISETRNITEHKLYILYMNNHWMLPYKIKNVRVNQKSKMVATTGQIWQRTLCRKFNKQSERKFNWHFFGYPFTNPRCLSFKLKPNWKM